MPPRIPVVMVFVVVYLAAVAGGGDGAMATTVTLWSEDIAAELARVPGASPVVAMIAEIWPEMGERIARGWLTLRLDEALAFFAAAMALPDAAWRPATTRLDRTASILCALAPIAAMAAWPALVTPAFGVLSGLAVGDALTAAGGARLNRAGEGRA